MSARDDLLGACMLAWEYRTHEGRDLWELDSNDLINAFAHELAEKIRNSDELRDLTDDHMSDCYAAADLIDPECSDE